MSDNAPSNEQKSEPKHSPKVETRVIVRGYPKTIYLWPSMVVGIIIFLIDYSLRTVNIFTYPSSTKLVSGTSYTYFQEYSAYLASIWLLILVFNLIVISFDFSLGKTFSVFVTIAVILLAYIVVKDAVFPGGLGPLPSFKVLMTGLDVHASPNFYLSISILLFLIFIATWLEARFNYWEFESNRITHHRGIFERAESWSAQNSSVITSTDDIFERLLFRSGTIHILDPEKKLHVIENVYSAHHKDKEIQEILSVVRVRTDNG